MAKTYAWLATGGGAWSLASNWDDITDGIDPSVTAPGAQDTAEIAGPTGSSIGTITGPGEAALALFSGNIALAGSFGFGSLSLGAGGTGGLLAIGSGASVVAGSALVASGSLLTGSGATLAVTGSLVLGTGQSGTGAPACTLGATNGGVIATGSLQLDASSAAILVDATSVVDIGGNGQSAAGVLTVEAGATLSGFGDANAYGAVANFGTIEAAGGELMLGATSGTGQLQIAGGAILELNGRVGTGQSVQFSGLAGTLALAAEIDAPGGQIAGFSIGDAIDELGSPISAAAYAATGQNTGILTLLYSSQVADTFTLLGNYTGDTFLVSGDGAGGSLVTLASSGSGGGTLSGGTTTPDNYLWTASGSGAWDSRTNWTDTTSGANPAKVAPGLHDLVTIAASPGQFLVVNGPGDAAALSLTGDVALAGAFGIGTLTLGTGGSAAVSATLDLLPGTALTATNVEIADGSLAAIGGGTALSVSGTLTLGGGVVGVGLPVTSLSAASGATIGLGGLVLGGGSGNTVTTDPTSRIEIGQAGHAAVGAVTIDAGFTVSGNGQINPFGSLVVNGTADAEGGTLTLGSVSGSGTLTIGGGAALQLEASTATGIDFSGAAGALLLANEFVTPTGTLTGFTVGDTIDIQNDPITGVVYAPGVGGQAGTLTLSYDGTNVARLLLAGSYAGDKFVLAPDGASGTDILVAKGSGGGGGGGQGSTDLLSWTNPTSGAWNRAANWTDVTTGGTASAPPGAQNPVLVTGPSDGSFQVLAGPGACATATFLGSTALTQSYAIGTLTVGGAGTGGTLALLANATLGDEAALVANGSVLVEGAGAAWTVQGVLTLGGGAAGQGVASTLVSASNAGTIELGGLALGGGLGDALTTDATGVIEIGTAGGAASGAITVDAGIAVAGNGSLNLGGDIVDNGTITAQGGTLSLGNVGGAGQLSIAAEAVLALDGGEALPIGFAGSGGTLLLEGTAEAPSGVISGFAQGDEIVTGTSLVTGVSYAPGTGGIGTLTLQYAGQPAAMLLLAGNYSGETFSILPDGAGSAIVVSGSGGASGGTTTPDDYVWTGADGNGQWNDAVNWEDVSAGQNPAAIAPGLNDIVTVQGGTGSYLTLTGPANAASLDLLGGVSLSGSFAVGALNVAGTLALGPQGTLTVASAAVTGDIFGAGGTLTCSGTLALSTGSALAATRNAEVNLGALLLSDGTVTTDGTGAVAVGGQGGVAGAVLVDPGATLAGNGAVNLAGAVIDNGEIVAQNGTLSLGAVSGDGTLEIGVGATLALQAGAGGVVIDFAGGGTLSITAGQAPAAAIADFGAGDSILLPVTGVTGSVYAATGPGLGTLTLYAGNTAVDVLTLLGVQPGQTFSFSSDNGSTLVTTEPGSSGTGGGMGHQGNYQNGPEDPNVFLATLPYYQQFWVGQVLGIGSSTGPLEVYVQVSPDGATWGQYQPLYANIGIVQSASADQKVVMPYGYVGLLAEGTEPLDLRDWNPSSVVVGNGGSDTIIGGGAADTLVGGVGPGNLFWAIAATDTVIGNGNDTVATGNGNYLIQTSTGRSQIFLGSGHDSVTSEGSDTIICEPGLCESTVSASGADTVYGPGAGMLNFIGGAGADVVVGTGGSIRFYGGSGAGSVLWANTASLAQYVGGSAAATVVGGSGSLDVQGGAGAVTVYGGTGQAYVQGAAGPSVFVLGEGQSTVLAASGNQVWLTGGANNTLVAGGGDVLLAGLNSFGNNTYWAGTGPTTVFAGHGSDVLMAGEGNSTMVGGSGNDVFGFINGPTHGAEQITNFQVGRDQIGLFGYGGGVNAVLATEKVSGGNTYFTLQDGTQVEVVGISGLSANSFIT